MNLPKSNRHVKCCVVGDGNVGKTCLLMAFATGAFNQEYVPTVYDNYRTNVLVDHETVSMHLWDTAGQDDYNRIRPLSYPDTDVFIVCYSIVDPTSLENVKIKWYPELAHFSRYIPRMLVGCKHDLRKENENVFKLKSKGESCVREFEGMQIQVDIKAQMFMECSALTRHNIHKVFERVARLGIRNQDNPDRPRKKCSIL